VLEVSERRCFRDGSDVTGRTARRIGSRGRPERRPAYLVRTRL